MAGSADYAGHAEIKGQLWAITAKVVETDYGRQFVGDVQPPGEAVRQQCFPGIAQADLVTEAEGKPFDDPLPEKPF